VLGVGKVRAIGYKIPTGLRIDAICCAKYKAEKANIKAHFTEVY